MSAKALLSAGLSILALFAAGGSLAQDSEGDEPADPAEMVNCISLSQVDHTEVVDDNTILFYMRNNDIYRNTLPHRCPGLDREEAFMYRVSTTQLCNVDVITVLDDLGPGVIPGASCGLGKFQPISEATAEEIKAIAERDEGAQRE